MIFAEIFAFFRKKTFFWPTLLYVYIKITLFCEKTIANCITFPTIPNTIIFKKKKIRGPPGPQGPKIFLKRDHEEVRLTAYVFLIIFQLYFEI